MPEYIILAGVNGAGKIRTTVGSLITSKKNIVNCGKQFVSLLGTNCFIFWQSFSKVR